MKASLKYISLLLAAIFLISGTMMVAFAEGEDGEEPVYSDPEPVDPDPVYSEPEVDPEPVDPDPVYSEPEVDPVPDTPVDYGDGDYTGSDNNYQVYEEDPWYYGDASNYSYNIDDDAAAGSVSSNTTLYNSSGMSAEEAAPNEWSDITLDEKTVKTGVTDFSAIKSNTETQDNGHWILYLGYLLLILSALGIIYFIAATVAQRKAAKKAARLERRRASSPARSAAARMDERDRRSSGSYQRASRFADEAPSRSRRVSSKADTGEVYIPRRAAKR